MEEISKLIDAFPEAGIYGTNYTIVNETKHKTRVAPIGLEKHFEKGYINYCQVYAKTLAMPLTSISVAIPRPIFNEMQGFPRGIKLGEDFMLWIRIALNYKVAFLNKPLAYYNQDVDVSRRGVGHMYKLEEHMLWNLNDIESVAQDNADYKRLVDNLRTYSLLPYYLSPVYHDAAQKELDKVDWKQQPFVVRRRYHQPMWMLKCTARLRKVGSNLKQRIRSI